jgi:hypothetical protein
VLGGLVALVASIGALVLGPSAMSGPDSKVYRATFTSSVPGGENGQLMSLTIENLGSPQLGSADVTAPAGVLIQSVSGLNATSSFTPTSIQLRDLNLSSGAPVTFPMVANISCPARNANWSITGRQNNNGSGSVFTLDPSSNLVTQVQQACTLSITVQPNHAEASIPITNTAYNDPVGQSVKVEARNNDNAVALAASADTVTLGKTAGFFTSAGTGFTGNALPLSSGGDVTFPNLKSDRTGFAFRLTATASGYNSSAPSNSFDIQVDGCKGPTCNPSTPPVGGNTHTQASVTGSVLAGGDSLGVGLIKYDQFNFPPGFCSTGAFEPLPQSDGFTTSVQVDVGSSGQRDYTVTGILDKFIMNLIPQNGADAVLTCFFGNRIDPLTGLPRSCSEDILAGLEGFPTVNDPNGNGSFRARCDVGGTEAWGGILPKAPPGTNSCTDPLTDPVVLSQNKSGGPPGSLVIKICKPWPNTVTATQLPWDGGGGWR